MPSSNCGEGFGERGDFVTDECSVILILSLSDKDGAPPEYRVYHQLAQDCARHNILEVG